MMTAEMLLRLNLAPQTRNFALEFTFKPLEILGDASLLFT